MMDSTNVTRRRVLRTLTAGAVVGFAGRGTARPSTAQTSVFVSGTDPSRAVENAGGSVVFAYDNFDFVAARVPDVASLRRVTGVTRVERDGPVEAIHHREGHDGGPNNGGDDDSGGSTSQTLPWGVDRIDAEGVGLDGTGVGVAVLDTGVDLSHPDLSIAGGTNCTGKGNGYDDKNGHGTHTSGIVAALDNEQGVRGVAPGVNLWGVKVLDNSGSGAWSNVVCGIDWCMTNAVPILSMSLGASSMPTAVATALSDAHDAGHVLVAAAGNAGNDQDGSCEEDNVDAPANHPDVLAVSAMTGDADGTNSDDVVASYSSVGPEVDVIAPGTDVRSTYKGDAYTTLSGTSMACPHVSGLAALVWEANGLGTPSAGDNTTVEDAVTATAEDVATIDCEAGDGLVDAEASLS